MKILVFGPSGSGKSYLASCLSQPGIPAYDADRIDGLSAWFSPSGAKFPAPLSAEEAISKSYSFLWSRKALNKFLYQHQRVFLFGGSGNVFNMIDLFDKAYFLKTDRELQLARIRNAERPMPGMDADENGAIIWGEWLEQAARERNIPFIDAAQTPQEIYKQINL